MHGAPERERKIKKTGLDPDAHKLLGQPHRRNEWPMYEYPRVVEKTVEGCGLVKEQRVGTIWVPGD
jgi:hypothetical protein